MPDLSNAEKRGIFLDAARWVLNGLNWQSFTDVERMAFHRYPDPKPEPKVVTTTRGNQYRVIDKRVEFRQPGWEWGPSSFVVSDLLTLAELVQDSLSQDTK